MTYTQFRWLLKTYLFGDWDRGALSHLLGALCINHLTYLLTYLLTYTVYVIHSIRDMHNVINIRLQRKY